MPVYCALGRALYQQALRGGARVPWARVLWRQTPQACARGLQAATLARHVVAAAAAAGTATQQQARSASYTPFMEDITYL